MALDLSLLWDFRRPDVSEQRFRAALASMTGDDATIESQMAPVKAAARTAYVRAHDIAQAARLDDLVIDALHMLAFRK